MKKTLTLILSLVSLSTMANYQLAKNKQAVVCYGEDNTSFDLSAKRTTVTFTTEGESNGAMKVTRVISDKKSYVTYTTNEGTLRLDDKGDSFLFKNESEPSPVECE